ncbi:MAG: hypothetical protein K2O96_04870 [Lachnospiraceae bacterium]|nr:hypothetical protein [Lachnospiraceae bacterium]
MTYKFYLGEERIPLSSLTEQERAEYLRWLNDRALRGLGYEPEEEVKKEKTA